MIVLLEIILLMSLIVPVLFILLVPVSCWKVFTKAGKPGWASLIPIYNIIVMLAIVRRPIRWIILLFIPIVNFFVAVIIAMDIAKDFGKGTGFGLGLLFLPLIFYPILGFGDSQYTRL
ncbi:MAG: hypothetical protein KOO69_01240 [Victivallales bacterium]|nr:hypothetical protein [Victivallales bacterium]